MIETKLLSMSRPRLDRDARTLTDMVSKGWEVAAILGDFHQSDPLVIVRRKTPWWRRFFPRKETPTKAVAGKAVFRF